MFKYQNGQRLRQMTCERKIISWQSTKKINFSVKLMCIHGCLEKRVSCGSSSSTPKPSTTITVEVGLC